MTKILFIDDDTEVLKINQTYFKNEGFEVYYTNNPEKGIEITRQKLPDCIILDIMMPNMNGYEVCQRIHKYVNTPIIFLTGRSSENDKINGLSLGADDYMVKPYSLRELKARIEVVIRRTKNASNPPVPASQIIINGLVIDKLAHKAFFKSIDLQLANREYETLLYMAENANRDITFKELGTAIFGTYQDSDRRSLMVMVSRLRKKLSGYIELENIIDTVWSVGYRLSGRKE